MPSTSRPTDLSSTISSLTQNVQNNSHSTSKDLLSRAKVALLKEAALKPHPQTPTAKLHAAQQVFELGALAEIRLTDPAAFTRYYDQLQPFYHYQTSTNANATPLAGSQRSKITGLYLLLLLSQGDYAGFHTVIETLEAAGNDNEGSGAATIKVEEDENIQYPMRLQQWLMEGSYDRVWKETQGDRVPSDEFRLFSDILTATIRTEIATCSEKAYGSIPVTNAKNLLFLESEGSVVGFSKERGWAVERDGRIHFPVEELGGESAAEERGGVLDASGQVIENALGYARELETIV